MRNLKAKKDDATQPRFAPTSITQMVVTNEDDPEKSFTIGSATVRELRFCDLLIQLDGYDAKALDEVTGKVLEEFDVMALLVGLRHFLPIVETHYEEMREEERRSFRALKGLIQQGKDVTVPPEVIKRAMVEFEIDLSQPKDDGSWKHRPSSEERPGGGDTSGVPYSASLAGDATVGGGASPDTDEPAETEKS